MKKLPSRPRRGFTLVEMLVVIALMALLMAFVGLTVPASLASQQLSASARQMAADLDHAALLAQRDSKPVEIRFYKCREPGGLGVAQYRAYQVGQIIGWDADGKPEIRFAGEVQRLPGGVVLVPGAPHTTLITPQNEKDSAAGDQDLEEAYQYVAYQIRPDGGTNLPRGTGVKTALTLILEPSSGVLPTQLPADFRTIVIDPLNGSVRSY